MTQLLGRTLRELRETAYGGKISQKRLAAALNVSAPSVSAWESGAIPPPDRLRAYAVLFASSQWIESDVSPDLDPNSLGSAERKKFDALMNRFDNEAHQDVLSAAPYSSPADFWHFANGGHIRIVCGALKPDPRVPYSSPTDHNFISLRNVADADALLELWGHLHSRNPGADIRFRVGPDLISADDRKSHLIILGNIAQMQGAGKLLPDRALPVKQIKTDGLDGEIFQLLDNPGTTFEPTLTEDTVTEDVALLARIPNPNFIGRSITICSGVFTRGVYGSVRILTDPDLRKSNSTALEETVTSLDRFAVLARVRVTQGDTDTPDLRDPVTWRHPERNS